MSAALQLDLSWPPSRRERIELPCGCVQFVRIRADGSYRIGRRTVACGSGGGDTKAHDAYRWGPMGTMLDAALRPSSPRQSDPHEKGNGT